MSESENYQMGPAVPSAKLGGESSGELLDGSATAPFAARAGRNANFTGCDHQGEVLQETVGAD